MKVTEKKSPKPKRSTVCLNMIVKNESHIIEKTLNNIVSKIKIDYWVISDTGSTDNTKELIIQFFKTTGIPGELVQHPWSNFGYNRTKALEYAFNKTDYLFIFDADDEIIGDLKFPVSLERDKYFLTFGTDFSYVRPLLVNNRKRWIFEGVLHEYLTNAIGETCEAGGPTITGNYYLQSNRLGSRSNDPDKYSKDAEILRKAFDEEIERNYGLACRYAFYCANSYKDAGPRYSNDAIYWYKKTVSLNGWIQEKWNSYFQLGLINRALGNIPEAIFFWLEAYNCLPDRIENLYEITKYYREVGQMGLAYEFYKIAKDVLQKKVDWTTHLFVFNDVYVYKLEYEYTIIACYVNVPKNINDQAILVMSNCQDNLITDNLLSNMKFYKDVLCPLREIDMSFKYTHTDGQIFNSSTPSIIRGDRDNNEYIMNVRITNYNISEKNEYLCPTKIMAINKRFLLDDKFNVLNEKIVHIPREDTNKSYLGIEDIKLFRDPISSDVIFTATGTLNITNSTIKTLCGKYSDSLEEIELTQNFKQTSCEKNWVFFEYNGYTCIVYEWLPLTICRFKEPMSSEVVLLEQRIMPFIFHRVRGSTNGFRFVENGETEIWFVCHIVSYETPRHYYHIFVVFDEKMNLLRHSAPFKFKGEPIEYCCGLIVEKDRVICTYSTWDRTTNIAIYDRIYIEEKIRYKPMT
jgi:tetratricopeptide (TPR) repeat protein